MTHCRRHLATQISNPLEEDSRMGPVVDVNQYKKIMGYIEKGTLLT